MPTMFHDFRIVPIFAACRAGALASACAAGPQDDDSASSSSGVAAAGSDSGDSGGDIDASSTHVGVSATSGSTSAGECDGETEFDGDLFVDDESDLSTLHCLVRINGSLLVGPSAYLASPLPFANLREVTGDLQIVDNAALASLDGLEALERAAGRVEIARNDALVSIRGLEVLAEMGGFEVYQNAQLADVHALAPSIHFLANDGGFTTVSLSALPSLVDLAGLEHVTSMEVDGTLSITVQYDDALTDVAGLSGFLSDGPRVDLQLLQLPALAQVRLIDVVALGELDMSGLDVVTALRLDALESARSIEITRSPMLADLSGLASLTEVGDVLSLGGCGDGDGVGTRLTDLTGLGALHDVRVLEITGQPLLTTLDGLSTDVSIEDLGIRNNAALPNEDALAYAQAVAPTDDIAICGNMEAPACVDGCPIRD